MKRWVIVLFIALLILAIMLAFNVKVSAASDTVTVSGELENVMTYYDTVEVSAYWPHEDSYTNNFKGQPLTELVGEIVAAPTGSKLIGKYICLVDGDRKLYRRVWDAGCKPGRIDLLVGDSADMNAWGLRECEICVMEEKGHDEH